MPMPFHEQLRNKRDLEFQARVLAAVEKPKPNPLWEFVNKPAILWLMSALFLTAGGAYLTNHQQCMRDADRLIDNYNDIASEIRFRRDKLADLIQKATSAGEVHAIAGNIPYLHASLKDTKLVELTGGFRRLWIRTHGDRAPFPPDATFRRFGQDRFFATFLDGSIPSKLTDKDLKPFQDFTRRIRRGWQAEANEVVGPTLVPNCSVTNTASIIFGGTPTIVEDSGTGVSFPVLPDEDEPNMPPLR